MKKEIEGGKGEIGVCKRKERFCTYMIFKNAFFESFTNAFPSALCLQAVEATPQHMHGLMYSNILVVGLVYCSGVSSHGVSDRVLKLSHSVFAPVYVALTASRCPQNELFSRDIIAAIISPNGYASPSNSS